MLSCFCGSKKSQSLNRSSKPSQINHSNKPSQKNLSFLDTIIQNNISAQTQQSTIQKMPKYIGSKDGMHSTRIQLVQQPTSKVGMKMIASVKQVSNQSESILKQSFSSDSDTVPYKNGLKESESSTERLKKFSHTKTKQSNLYEVRHSHTKKQNPVECYFSIDKEVNKFHSHSRFKVSNGPSSNKCSASIDYSKYSEQDMKVESSEILDLDQEMEGKLQQLEQSQLNEERNQMSRSVNYQNDTKNKPQLQGSQHIYMKKQTKFQSVENDLNELQRVENEIHKNIKKSSKALNSSKYKGQLKGVKFSLPKDQNNQELQRQKQLNELVQKTVQSQLDIIGECKDLFFCTKQTVKAPQSLDPFRKFMTNSYIPQFQQSLEQAENSFHCNSINEQFSRALITKKFGLVLSIFEKMTYEERNNQDPKGYSPVHLAILQAILDDRAFEIAKKLMYHSDIKMNVKSPTGWSPLQETISYKHIRLAPNVFVASHRKKISLIRESLAEASSLLSRMKDFEMCLDVKVDSFIPLVGNLTPNDTITITKIGDRLLIDYTLVGYEFLSCKRRDMGFLISGDTILAINRSKGQYCDILEELDKEQIQMLVVESLQSQTKKIDPIIKNFDLKQAKTIFDNEVTDRINNYNAKKYLFSLNYTSMTEKRMPQKIISQNNKQNTHKNQSPLNYLQSWQSYTSHQHKVNIKPKNKNKKIELQMWLSQEYEFDIENLIKIFELFALSNPLAKTISDFLMRHFYQMHGFKGKFPVKIDIPINFSLFFNLEFRGQTQVISGGKYKENWEKIVPKDIRVKGEESIRNKCIYMRLTERTQVQMNK